VDEADKEGAALFAHMATAMAMADNNNNMMNDNNNNDGNDLAFASDIILALTSLYNRHSYATCDCISDVNVNGDVNGNGSAGNGSAGSGGGSELKFTLRPMLNAALTITDSTGRNSSSRSGSGHGRGRECGRERGRSMNGSYEAGSTGNRTGNSIGNISTLDQMASSLASTGFELDLQTSCRKGEVKIVQLQGLDGNSNSHNNNTSSSTSTSTSTSGDGLGEEANMAIFQMGDYIRGIEDVKWSKLPLEVEAEAEAEANKVQVQEQVQLIDLFLECIWEKNNITSNQSTLTHPDSTKRMRMVSISSIFTGTFCREQELIKAMQRRNNQRARAGKKDKPKNHNYDVGDEEDEEGASCSYVLLHPDKWINELIAVQLLLPRRLAGGGGTAGKMNSKYASYWFTLPKLGPAAKRIQEGRRRMINRLQRARPYGYELKRSKLELNASPGGMMGPFHVRDLLARGVVVVKETPNGQFIKLAR